MKGDLGSGAKNAMERAANAAKELNNLTATPTPQASPAEPASTPEPTATPEPNKNPQMDELERLADEPYESSFFNRDDDESEEASTESDPEPTIKPDVPAAKADTKPKSPTIRKIKAAGKVHEVDLSDEKKLDQLLAMGLGGRKAFSEADKLKKEVASMKSQLDELTKYKKAIDYLEEAKDDDEEAFRRVTGGRSLNEAFKRIREKEEFFATATTDEIEQFELKERLARLEKAKEAEAATAARLKEDLETTSYQSEKKALQTRMAAELNKVSFSELVSDTTEAHEWDEAIHAKAGKGIKRYWEKFGDRHPDGVPDALIKREYDRAAKFFKKQFAAQVDSKVAELDTKRSEEAKTNAQVASTKNYSTDNNLEKMKKFRGRPTAMWGKGGIFK